MIRQVRSSIDPGGIPMASDALVPLALPPKNGQAVTPLQTLHPPVVVTFRNDPDLHYPRIFKALSRELESQGVEIRRIFHDIDSTPEEIEQKLIRNAHKMRGAVVMTDHTVERKGWTPAVDAAINAPISRKAVLDKILQTGARDLITARYNLPIWDGPACKYTRENLNPALFMADFVPIAESFVMLMREAYLTERPDHILVVRDGSLGHYPFDRVQKVLELCDALDQDAVKIWNDNAWTGRGGGPEEPPPHMKLAAYAQFGINLKPASDIWKEWLCKSGYPASQITQIALADLEREINSLCQGRKVWIFIDRHSLGELKDHTRQFGNDCRIFCFPIYDLLSDIVFDAELIVSPGGVRNTELAIPYIRSCFMDRLEELEVPLLAPRSRIRPS